MGLDRWVHLSDDEDSRNDHLPTADSRKSWWKPLPAKERPMTPEPTWTIPSSNVSDFKNNWATSLASTYVTPAKNSLLAKTRDMTNFLNWYCRQVNKTKLTHADLEGQAYEVVKAFYTNPEGDQVRINVNRPLPLGGPSSHVTIQSQFFFNKDLEYLIHGSKGSSYALSNSKMKAASYPDFGLELLVLEHMWIEDVRTYDKSAKYGISHRADLQEHTIDEKDFKNLHPSNFEDLNLLLLQGHLDHLPSSDKKMLSTAAKLWTRNIVIRQRVEDFQLVVFPVNNNKRKIMLFNEIYKFSEGTLTRILEALAYRVKEFKIKRLNLGMNTRFWTKKDVTRSKEFVAAIER
nr:hypothetical protein [Tanacetum cinerariifolium]